MHHAHDALGDAHVHVAAAIAHVDREPRADHDHLRVAGAHDQRRPTTARADLELDLAARHRDQHATARPRHRERRVRRARDPRVADIERRVLRRGVDTDRRGLGNHRAPRRAAQRPAREPRRDHRGDGERAPGEPARRP
jgi:hypothetical protein